VSQLYELHIYTMGDKGYAGLMADILDPQHRLFKGRVISAVRGGVDWRVRDRGRSQERERLHVEGACLGDKGYAGLMADNLAPQHRLFKGASSAR
jgi:hypothetical protein